MSRLRVGIDYTSAFHQRAGIGRLTRELLRHVAELDGEDDYHLFVQQAGREQLPNSPGENFTWHPTRISERWLTRIWQRAHLPIPRPTWWTGSLDLYHAPDFVLPPLPRGLPTILTVPDLSFVRSPGTAMPSMEAYLGRGVPRSVRRATHIIAISESTRDDLVELYGIVPEKITVIYCGVEPHFRRVEEAERLAEVREKYGIGEGRFVLTVGTLEPRKNHIGLVRAYAQLQGEERLVIAGGAGWSYDEVPAEVVRLGLEGRVVFVGYVDDSDLPALYSAAELFVFPSFYEGFGLPLLEAMACGTAVVASDVASLPEVVGEAGLLVGPHDIKGLAGAMGRVLEDEELRRRMGQAGVEQAAKFTWRGAAEQLVGLYRRVGRLHGGG